MFRYIVLGLLALLALSLDVSAKVNVNTASPEVLSKELKNIGEKKAAAIVEYRKMHGKFKSIEDLKKVDGIGDSTIEINRHMLSTSGKAKAPAKAKAKAMKKHTGKTPKSSK